MSEIEKAARIVGSELIGGGTDSFRPMSAKMCHALGNFLWNVIEGETADDALVELRKNLNE